MKTKQLCRVMSTKGLSQKDAMAFWADEVCSLRQGLLIDFPETNHFSGKLVSSAFGPTHLAHLKHDQLQMSRFKRHISASSVDDFCLLYVTNGIIRFSNDILNAAVGAGEYMLFDTTIPYRMQVGQNTDYKVLIMPRDWFNARISEPVDVISRLPSSTSPWGRAVVAMMEALQPDQVNRLALPPGVVADQVAAVIALAAGPPPVPLKSWQRLTLQRLRQSMSDRLHEQTLDPEVFAAEQGISKRTLHGLFAASGTSFGQELWNLRLERARALLDDCRFDNRTMGEVAALVGFVNAGHFGRRFRARYGLTPGAYREVRRSQNGWTEAGFPRPAS